MTTSGSVMFEDEESEEPPLGGFEEMAPGFGAPPPWAEPRVVASTADALHRIRADEVPSLGITSAVRGEGRTTIALAAGIAERFDYGRRVILLDLDLGRPSLGDRTGAPSAPGLAEYLRGTAALEECIRWHDGLLGILPAGSVGADAESLTHAFLRSATLAQIGLLTEVVVADLPPLLPAGVGARLAAAFATVLMVVRVGSTSTETISSAVRSFATPPPVLLNRAEPPGPRPSSPTLKKVWQHRSSGRRR